MFSDTPHTVPIRLSDDPLVNEIRDCRLCQAQLPLGPRPVVQFSGSARLLIIGQAPGLKVHHSGIPWDDPSGQRLRQWLNLTPEQFYHPGDVAIVPMGFCYPGRGKSGDNPPDPRCAPQWHRQVLQRLPQVRLTLLVGQYAQRHYLEQFRSLTDNVRQWRDHLDQGRLPLPHPSPRNNLWLRRNPWFEQEVVPELQHRVRAALAQHD